LLGKEYEAVKKKHGGEGRANKSKGQNDHLISQPHSTTRERVAKTITSATCNRRGIAPAVRQMLFMKINPVSKP